MVRYTGKIYDKLREIFLDRRRRLALGAVVLTGASITISGVRNITSSRDEIEVEKGAEYTSLISSAYTNMYSNPVNNKKEKMNMGEFIEFESTSEAYYNERNGEWRVVRKEEAPADTKWLECKVVDDENNGYIPSEYVDKYYPYSADGSITFMVKEDEESDEREEITIQNARVWVCKDDSTQGQLSKAIIRDKNDAYLAGYVDASLLKKDSKDKSCVGIVNNITFLREYPLVAELDESIILGQATNGQKLKILSTEVLRRRRHERNLVSM